MRATSKKKKGAFVIYAVSGTNTISFAIDFREVNTKGLLGFAVERLDNKNGVRKFLDGYKLFRKIDANPSPDKVVSTYAHPIQSFTWDDFACLDDTTYQYLFYPLKGTPDKLDRSMKPVSVSISTEPLYSKLEHDVFFNRGVASSQAYRRKFFNLRPDVIRNASLKQKALDWLSRDLDNAILKFIAQAKKGDSLFGCFYEFYYAPVLNAFAEAISRGVKVTLIVDAKKYNAKDEKGNPASVPRTKNLESIKNAGIPRENVIQRTADTNYIQHNKFIVYVPASNRNLTVWTGSTNITEGGIHGQTNVGHWIRNTTIARKYKSYWDLLSKDPGAKDNQSAAVKKEKRKAYRDAIEKLQPDIEFLTLRDIPEGITAVFSPRNKAAMLDTYIKLFNESQHLGCITLAFGINKGFKNYLIKKTKESNISFLLLEKEDKPNARSKDPFVVIGAKQNTYKAWGSLLEDNLHNWAKEISTREIGLNKFVAYIHSKFLMVDPLGEDPIVITGSANFSDASTRNNDENMVIIRGNKRVADIYFTEFNRLFSHYYFRSVFGKMKKDNSASDDRLFLDTTDKWIQRYKKGSLGLKRVQMFTEIKPD